MQSDKHAFVMPDSIEIESSTHTDTYAKFTIRPFEKGFGHTIGNSFRRILLSSLEGAAISSIKIDGVSHEFVAIPGILEDMTELVLNIKRICMKCSGETPRKLELIQKTSGPVLAGSINIDGFTEVVNKDQVICNITDIKKVPGKQFRMEIEVIKGRGYKPDFENKRDDHPIGVIPVDCLFSPIKRVLYKVSDFRIGQATDKDQLELEVWTDGRIKPQDALRRSAFIFSNHLNIFSTIEGDDEDVIPRITSKEDEELLDKLLMNLGDLELSVRSKNCLRNANLNTMGELIQRTETEMLKFRNFGRKSLDEIKEKLVEMNLGLGMPLKEEILAALPKKTEIGE